MKGSLKLLPILSILLSICAMPGTMSIAHAQQSTAASSRGSLFSVPKEEELLEPDLAFKVQIVVQDNNKLVAELIPAPGYYIYKDKVKFSVKDGSGVSIRSVKFPAGEIKTDLTFGKTEVYKTPFRVAIAPDHSGKTKSFTVMANYQGCHEKLGVCYAPIEKAVKVVLH